MPMISPGAAAAAATATASVVAVVPTNALESTDQQKRRQLRRQRTLTAAVAITSVASLLTGFLAMYLQASAVCYAAFMFPCIMAPAVILQRRRLNKLPSLMQEINLCRELVNRLATENTRLERARLQLTQAVHHLEASEAQLQQLAARNGYNQTTLQELVRENGRISRQMRQLSQAAELQALLSAMLSSDSNHDRHISAEELERLSARLQVFSASQTRPVDDGLLRKAFHMSGASSISTTTLFRWTNELMVENEQNMQEPDSLVDDLLSGGEVGTGGPCQQDSTESDCRDVSFGYERCVD